MDWGTWVVATLLIAAWSAFLVFVDPLTWIAEWWDDHQWDKRHH